MRTRRSIAYDKELKTILDNYDNMSLAEVLKNFLFCSILKTCNIFYIVYILISLIILI